MNNKQLLIAIGSSVAAYRMLQEAEVASKQITVKGIQWQNA